MQREKLVIVSCCCGLTSIMNIAWQPDDRNDTTRARSHSLSTSNCPGVWNVSLAFGALDACHVHRACIYLTYEHTRKTLGCI